MLVVHRFLRREEAYELTAWWAESEKEPRRCRNCGLAFVSFVGCCRVSAEGVRTWSGEVMLVEGVVWKEKLGARSHEAWIRCVCVPKRSAWSGRW